MAKLNITERRCTSCGKVSFSPYDGGKCQSCAKKIARMAESKKGA